MKRSVSLSVCLAAGVVVAAAALSPSFASSHREAPLTASDPQVDATDLYGFVSPDAPNTVTLVSAWIPFQSPAGGPNFYPWGTGVNYDIHIDNNGDALADITYRWTFKSIYQNVSTFLYNTGPVSNLQDPTLNFSQTYTLQRIAAGTAPQALLTDAPVAPSYVGQASMPDYNNLRTQALLNFNNGAGRSFVGQSDDPFFLDLRIFDLLYGGNLKEVGNDTLAGFNVNAMAIQVPKTDLALGGDATANPIVGMWTTASRPSQAVSNPNGSKTLSGPEVQVSRLGSPLVNEVVVPLSAKDLFNASKPEADGALLPAVQDPEVPKLIQQIYNIPAPVTPRDDLVQAFLTGVPNLNQPPNVTQSEQLRLNMSIPPSANPNRLGVLAQDNAGFPNGRRLTDDVVDIELRVLEGALRGVNTDLGDGVDTNDVAFLATFPYLPLPHSGSAATPLGVNPGTSTGGVVPTGGAGTGAGGTAGGGGLPVVALAAAGAGLVLLGAGLVSRRRHRVATIPEG